MIPWNKQQEMGLQSEAFILLLHKLGFHLPADVGKCFPRIPHFWSADHIYQLAQKIGPIRKDKMKIDLSIFDIGSKRFSLNLWMTHYIHLILSGKDWKDILSG